MTLLATTRRLWLLAAFLALFMVPSASAQRDLYTSIQASPEPLPNCVPAVQGQTQPFIWDITAQLYKTCTATNTWSSIGGGGGGGGFYQTIQVNGSAQSQQITANYVAGTNMTITPTTVGGVTTLTFIASNTASVAFSAITSGTNTQLNGLIGTGASLGVTGTGTIAATTALALAANPSTCAGGSAPVGILANGNSTGCASFLSNPMTLIGQMIGGGSAGAPTAIAAGLTGQIPTAINAAVPTFQSPGLRGGNGGLSVSANSYVMQCDNATTLLDRGTVTRFIAGAGTVIVPDPTTTGCGNNFAFGIIADGVSLTVNRTSTAVFNIYNGSASSDNQTSFGMTTGQYAAFSSPDNVNWTVRLSVAGGGSSSFPLTVSGTVNSGGLPCFTATTTEASSAAIGAGILIKGGGAGGCVSATSLTDNGSTVVGTEPLLVSAIVDGLAPVTDITVSSCTLGISSGCNATAYQSGYTYNQNATAGQAITLTLPPTVKGSQYCVANSIVSGTGAADTGVLTVYPPASSYVILNGVRNTIGGGGTHGVASGGAAADAACFVANDATDWTVYVQHGTWTAN